MSHFPQFFRGLLWSRIQLRPPTAGQAVAGLSILGLAGLCYFLGAAVMYFRLPSSDYLDKAFRGGQAWHERGRSQLPPRFGEEETQEGVTVDKPDKTFDGGTLYTTTQDSRAILVNMRGEVLHQWQLPFSRAWDRPPHVPHPLRDERIHWFRCHLYPNGDLLAVYHADGDTPYGYGLVKLDKDSKLLWAYAGNVHHDLDVGEDGTIYTLTHKLVAAPPADLNCLPSPYIADAVVVLSAEGSELESIPILEAFRDSPYAPALASIAKDTALSGLPPRLAVASQPAFTPSPAFPFPPGFPLPPGAPTGPNPLAQGDFSALPGMKGDVLHANSVKVLGRTLAPKFRLFKEGQVLVSLRSLDTLAVLDRATHSVAWAARGIWRMQHDPEFLDNGHLLLFDNMGSVNGSRVLEYDPLTQATPWAYTIENADSSRALWRGMKQRLPNGNTLIVDPDRSRLLEVTANKEVVWEMFCPLSSHSQQPPAVLHVLTGARRYGPEALRFLGENARARP